MQAVLGSDPGEIIFWRPPPTGDRRTRVVLSDLVPPAFRMRKRDTEFPMGLDCLEVALHQKGFIHTDFAFLPTEAHETRLRQAALPLTTLGVRGQTPQAVRDCQVWGINMMNHLQTPALFSLLELAGVPVLRTSRGPQDPLVVLGGHVWPNPLPLSDFYDVLVLGDGEQTLTRIALLAEALWGQRAALLQAIAALPGVVVPDRTAFPVVPQAIPFEEPEFAAGSSYLLNGVGAILLARGCQNACAFCNNSVVGAPYRVKPFSQLRAHIDRLAQAGARKLLLLSASASSYRSEGYTISDVAAYVAQQGLEVRTMSDRPEALTSQYLAHPLKARGKLILAVEASPRIRAQVLHKNLTDQALEAAVATAARSGIRTIQLYIILAIPPIPPGILDYLPGGFEGETLADLAYLADLARSIVARLAKEASPGAPPPSVILDCMPFIPAIGTPMERAPFPTYARYQTQLQALGTLLGRAPEIQISPGMDEVTHLLQAYLERNTASAGQVLWQTWKREPACLTDVERLRQGLIRSGGLLEGLFETPALLFTPCHAIPKELPHGRAGCASR